MNNTELIIKKKCDDCDFVLEVQSSEAFSLFNENSAIFLKKDMSERLERGHDNGGHKKRLERHSDLVIAGHTITGIVESNTNGNTLIEGYCKTHYKYYYIENDKHNCEEAKLMKDKLNK